MLSFCDPTMIIFTICVFSVRGKGICRYPLNIQEILMKMGGAVFALAYLKSDEIFSD